MGLSVVTGLLLPEACLVERAAQKVTTEPSSPRVIASRSKNRTPGLETEGETQARLQANLGVAPEEHWSGLPFPSLGDLPDSGIKSLSPA